MRNPLLATALFFASTLAFAAPFIPCLNPGESADICFNFDPGSLGLPPGSEVVPGSVVGCEKDPIGSDDPLGGGTYNSATGELCIEIENDNGRLMGPNGIPQNGVAEGQCIEVFVKFKARYLVEICTSGRNPMCWEEWRESDEDTRGLAVSVCAC